MPVKPISTEQEHLSYLSAIEAAMDSGAWNCQTDILAGLVETYEDIHYPIEHLSIADMTRHLLIRLYGY